MAFKRKVSKPKVSRHERKIAGLERKGEIAAKRKAANDIKRADKLANQQHKSQIAKAKYDTKMNAKYGDTDVKMREYAEKKKLNSKLKTQEMFAKAGAHVVKATPYVNAAGNNMAELNDTVRLLLDEDYLGKIK